MFEFPHTPERMAGTEEGHANWLTSLEAVVLPCSIAGGEVGLAARPGPRKVDVFCGKGARIETDWGGSSAELLKAGEYDEMIGWKVVVTSSDNSGELLMADLTDAAIIARITLASSIGGTEELLRADSSDDEGLFEAVVSRTDESMFGGTTDVEAPWTTL